MDQDNKIHGQQQLRPCKHFLLGQIARCTTDCQYCILEKKLKDASVAAIAEAAEVDRLNLEHQGLSNDINDLQNTIETLKGEQTVMVNLMMRALRVIETIESENSDEESEMTQLKGHMEKLINQSITSLMRVKNEKL